VDWDGDGRVVRAAGPTSGLHRSSFAIRVLCHRSSSARLALCLGDLNLFAHLLTTFDSLSVVGEPVVQSLIGDRPGRALESSVLAASGDQHVNCPWCPCAPIFECVKNQNQSVCVCTFLLKGK